MAASSTYPVTYTDVNETGCCPVPNVRDWDRCTIELDQRFIRQCTRSLLHVPMNMGRVMTALSEQAAAAGATMPADHGMILSHDLSAWKAEQLYAVTSEVDGADNVVLEGTFATCVFEGPYGRAREWRDGGSSTTRGPSGARSRTCTSSTRPARPARSTTARTTSSS